MNNKRARGNSGSLIFMKLKNWKATAFCILASGGVIATLVSAAHETPKVQRLIHDAQADKQRPLKKSEKAGIYVKGYFPSILLATGTIACIFASNVMNKRYQAAIAEAYLLSSQAYQEYRKAVDEVTDQVATQKVVSSKLRPTYTDGEKLSFYIEYHNRIFESTMLEVTDAEYQLNRKLALNGCAMLNEFLDLLGLPQSESGNVLGWDYNTTWIDFDHGVVEVDGMECFVITCRQRPWIDVRGYPSDE